MDLTRDELTFHASQLLQNKDSFFILSMYAVGLSPMIGLNIAQTHFKINEPEWGEFFLKSAQGRNLPMGTFLRFKS
jgi:23S rRNA (cytosine1962-C5)-methyltransferase